MTILAVVKISKNFRVTIPKKVRDILELEKDNEIVFFKTEGWEKRVCLRKS